jgi:GNAT superfamily N-acetyltransferase
VTDPAADLVARIRRAASAFMIAWVEGLRDLPGNPDRVTVERFGDAVALACETLPDLDFVNSVHGLDPGEDDRVADVTAFYRERGLRGWTELAPMPGHGDLMDRLTSAGWAQTGFWCSFHGAPDPPPAPADVEVVEATKTDMPEFARIHLDGHEVPDEDRASAEAAVRGWYGRPGWTTYLARVDGVAAASGALMVDAGLGYLANAATLPGMRRRGCQSALLARRIADAAAAGCDMVASLAEFGSPSQRNLERAGLRVAFTQAVWRMEGDYPTATGARGAVL